MVGEATLGVVGEATLGVVGEDIMKHALMIIWTM